MGVIFPKRKKTQKIHDISRKCTAAENLLFLKSHAILNMQKISQNSKKPIFSLHSSISTIKHPFMSPHEQKTGRFDPFSIKIQPFQVNSCQNIQKLQENSPVLTPLPMKQTVYNEILQNFPGKVLPPLKSFPRKQRRHVKSLHFSNESSINEDLSPNNEKTKQNDKKEEKKIAQSMALSELSLLKSEKEIKVSITSTNRLRPSSFHSNAESPTKSPIKPDFSVFSPKRDYFSNNELKKPAKIEGKNEKKEETHRSNSLSTLKFLPELSKYYKEAPKEAYKRIYEKVQNKELGDKRISVQSLRDGRVILCKKEDLITRNNRVIQILKPE